MEKNIEEIIKQTVEEATNAFWKKLTSLEGQLYIKSIIDEKLEKLPCIENEKWGAYVRTVDPQDALNNTKFIKELRDLVCSIKKFTLRAAITTIVTGILTLLWWAFKHYG